MKDNVSADSIRVIFLFACKEVRNLGVSLPDLPALMKHRSTADCHVRLCVLLSKIKALESTVVDFLNKGTLNEM